MNKSTLFILLSTTYICLSQSFKSSNLPLIFINTDFQHNIPNEPRTIATMTVVDRGEGKRNLLKDRDSSQYHNYSGRIDIEIRGSSSQVLPKKQYRLSTKKLDGVSNNNVPLLGMPKDNDWILNGLAFDSSLIRDHLSYHLSRSLGNYAPRTRYCEVIINGAYQGLYMLQENIKQGDRRVDIAKIDSNDTSLPDLSGGYITKIDKVEGTDVAAWHRSSNLGIGDLNFLHELPKPSEVTTKQQTYIQTIFDKLDLAAASANTSIVDGYPSLIDIPSFVDFMILNELSSNVDGYQFSTYFHKDRRGKLRAGPIWDFNLTYGNDLKFWTLDRSKYNVWQFSNGDNEGSKFWKNLYQEPKFRCELTSRWNELIMKHQALHTDTIKKFIDQTAQYISEAAVRDHEQWGKIGDHAMHIRNVKDFIVKRTEWINTNLGTFVGCKPIQNYPLVITKIMYHPGTPEFGESDDQEFIEITNNGTENLDLTGIYFGGLGLSYVFPTNTSLPAQSSLILSSDRLVFHDKYGKAPFDEYSRNLSNAGQKILLQDAFGNIIDQVDYLDQSPWPNADGNGAFLELIDPNLDNNIASNWVANFSNTIGIDNDLLAQNSLNIYPNPAQDILNIQHPEPIDQIQLYDLQGHLLLSQKHNDNTVGLHVGDYAPGMYFIKVNTSQGSVLQKFVKD